MHPERLAGILLVLLAATALPAKVFLPAHVHVAVSQPR